MDLYSLLLILHFLGLAMGFAVSFSNMVMLGLVQKAAPAEKPVLARFPPAMMRVGDIGITLLWVTGLAMIYMRGGFSTLPGMFHVKLTAVVILTGLIGYIHVQMKKIRLGDTAAAAKLPAVGRVAFLMALVALVFAVLTFG